MTFEDYKGEYDNLLHKIMPLDSSIVLPKMLVQVFENTENLNSLRKIFDYYASLDELEFNYETLADVINAFLRMVTNEYTDLSKFLIKKESFNFDKLVELYVFINNEIKKANVFNKSKLNEFLVAMLNGVKVCLMTNYNTLMKYNSYIDSNESKKINTK